MKTWQIVVTGLLGLALAGCRTDPELSYLRSDNFKKEQEIYRLRDRVEDLEEALTAAAPPQPVVERVVPKGELPSDRAAAPSFTRPGGSNAEPELPTPGSLDVSPGTEVMPGEVPDRMKVRGQSELPILPPGGPGRDGSSHWNPVSHRPNGPAGRNGNDPVCQITLHPALTGGIGTEDRASDRGLLVVVEPRDFNGNIIDVPGDISVVLLDPALSGERAKLGRWNFSAQQTKDMFHSGSQQGIHLRLPWASQPVHDRLQVAVRYTTPNGLWLRADRSISVALRGAPPSEMEQMPDLQPAQTASRPQRPQWSPMR